MPGVKNWRWSNSYYRLFDRLTGKWQLNDPAPDYLVKYKLDGSDSSLTRFGGDNYRIAPACPEATGSHFNGIDQYYTGNDDAILAVTSAFSLSYWFYATDKTNSNDSIFFGSTVGAGGDGFKIAKTTGGNFYIRSNAVSVANVVTPTYVDGNWHHVVVNYDGVNVSSYVDGIAELAPTAFSPTPITDNGISIAQNRGTGFYPGGLDDIRLYNRVLSTGEITRLYNYRCDFNPSQTSSRAWYDAQDQTTITESLGAVSQWDDKSGNIENVSQASGASQPTTLLNNANGLNVITFSGAQSLSALNAIEWTENFHAFMVYKRDILSNTTVMGSFNAVDGDWRMAPGNSANNRSQVRQGGATRTQSISGTDITNFYIHELEYSNDTLYSVENGVRSNGLSVVYPGLTTAELFTIGARSNIANFFDGDVAEIVIYQSLLSQDAIDRVQGYLAWKWGLVSSLPAGHKYKSYPPKI